MRVLFMGSSEASAQALRGILKSPVLNVVGVVTQPDRPSGRSQRLSACPCKAYAFKRKIGPVITPVNVNAPEVVETLAALKPDVIVVVAFGQIMRKPILEMAPHGCINCHFSLLPKYRGAAPVQSAILAGDEITGVTVMQMDEKMDTGDILLTANEPICSDDDAGELMNRLGILGAVTLAKALKMMLSGELKRTPQDDSAATYCKKISKSDGLVDWNEPAYVIERKVRAYYPWPGAYTFFRRPGQENLLRLKIHETVVVPETEEMMRDVKPGTICMISPIGPLVRTGGRLLGLVTVQPECSKPMSARDFLNGNHLGIGCQFVSK